AAHGPLHGADVRRLHPVARARPDDPRRAGRRLAAAAPVGRGDLRARGDPDSVEIAPTAPGDLPRAGGPVASEVRDPATHGRRTGRAVFGLLLTLYGITAGGSLTTTDSVVTFELTRQMAAHGTV